MGIFSKTASSAGSRLYKGLVIFGANKFPDLMSDAQLQEFAEAVSEAGQDVAKLRARLIADKSDLAKAQANFDTMANAARILLDKRNAAKDDELNKIEEGITEAKEELKNRKAILEDAKRRVEETEGDVTAKEADLNKAAQYLTTARQKLMDARNERERLQDEKKRQEARQKEAHKSVGIDGFDTNSIVLDSMTGSNAKLRQTIDGLRTSNEAIEKASKPTHSSALEDALNAGQPDKKSDADELADLLK